MPSRIQPSELTAALGYTFTSAELLQSALTHRSAGPSHNERLEFLGDAILGVVITEHLYHAFPDADEGQLTRTRARLVKGETLASIAREIELGSHVVLGEGEMKSGGWRRDSILANTFEAILGAIFVEAGFEHCKRVITTLFESRLASVSPSATDKDPKTTLQEYLQQRGAPLPVYETLSVSGPSHDQQFTVTCQTNVVPETVSASGKSRRRAEQAAARSMLKKIGANQQ